MSPCVFPLIPFYISFITGISFNELSDSKARRKIFLHTFFSSILFVLGFSAVFISLGASASVIAKAFEGAKRAIELTGGILLVIFGLHLCNIIKIPFLNFEKKIHFKKRPLGALAPFLFGLIFAAGWTPCIGPLAAAVITSSSQVNNIYHAMGLMFVFSLGIGLPFIIIAMAFNIFLNFSSIIRKHLNKIQLVSGILIIITGILFIFNKFEVIISIMY
ncbi:MAG: sulfite exporter TauE/SafE family protein [Candidatus Aureabacteria bacterium]|nr:sulfite exporter TauE/SafE family protein [Candidatus Auribacterota bacterium]